MPVYFSSSERHMAMPPLGKGRGSGESGPYGSYGSGPVKPAGRGGYMGAPSNAGMKRLIRISGSTDRTVYKGAIKSRTSGGAIALPILMSISTTMSTSLFTKEV